VSLSSLPFLLETCAENFFLLSLLFFIAAVYLSSFTFRVIMPDALRPFFFDAARDIVANIYAERAFISYALIIDFFFCSIVLRHFFFPPHEYFVFLKDILLFL